MTAKADRNEDVSISHPTKKLWEKPAIVIERSLVAEAQGGVEEPNPIGEINPPFMGGLMGSFP
ncbi:MAG: hypothetical protein H0T73_16380 [Ardenticatenales bacterium]|nr:hypothetical protein [Ardenticatenales bacterium]